MRVPPQAAPCASAGRIGWCCRKTFGHQLLTSYGRGELTNYHRHLLKAVEAPN
jgi:hypothetical protein